MYLVEGSSICIKNKVYIVMESGVCNAQSAGLGVQNTYYVGVRSTECTECRGYVQVMYNA